MIKKPVIPLTLLFYLLEGSTDIEIIQLNGNSGREVIYKGSNLKSLVALKDKLPSIDSDALVVPYSGIYNNRTTGRLEIEVWNLQELEDAYYEEI